MSSRYKSKLSNQLISVFAVLDGWLDKDDSFALDGSPGSALSLLHQVLAFNHFLLANISSTFSDRLALNENESVTIEPIQQYLLIRPVYELTDERYFVDYLQTLNGKTADSLRRELRDQLYQCLCLADIEESSGNEQSTSRERVQLHEIVEAIVSNALEHIKQHNVQSV